MGRSRHHQQGGSSLGFCGHPTSACSSSTAATSSNIGPTTPRMAPQPQLPRHKADLPTSTTFSTIGPGYGSFRRRTIGPGSTTGSCTSSIADLPPPTRPMDRPCAGLVHALGSSLSNRRTTRLHWLLDAGHAPSYRLPWTTRHSPSIAGLRRCTILLPLQLTVTNELQHLNGRPLFDVPASAATDRPSTAICTKLVPCSNAKLGPSRFPPGHEQIR